MSAGTLILIAKLIDLVMLGVEMNPEAREQAEKLSEKLHRMIDENRDPTLAEWDEINLHTDSLMVRLRQANA